VLVPCVDGLAYEPLEERRDRCATLTERRFQMCP
jgi:hypothetical protein